MKIYKILDIVILVLVALFFIGILGSSFPPLTLEEPIVSIPEEVRIFLDILIYPIIGLLIIDLALKYRKTKNPKKFVKKYWVDIFMLALIPIFSLAKFFKIGLSLTKQLKTVKMGAKILHKTKKVTKKEVPRIKK